MENLILAESTDEQEKALAELLPMQRDDFVGILEAMDGLPVTIRLIDPPLHEFLPDYTDLSVEVALARRARRRRHQGSDQLLEAVKRLHEAEPDARAARRPARHRDPGPVRDAGPGDPGGGRRCGSRPAATRSRRS